MISLDLVRDASAVAAWRFLAFRQALNPNGASRPSAYTVTCIDTGNGTVAMFYSFMYKNFIFTHVFIHLKEHSSRKSLQQTSLVPVDGQGASGFRV